MTADTMDAEGAYLARARKPDCGNCGQEMVKAHRIHLGTGYCSTCYPKIFPARTCHVCGKSARAHRNDETPTCGACLRNDRSCLRCGKLTPRAGIRVGERVACEVCAPYYRQPEQCEMCPNMSTRLSRSTAFPEKGRMCEKCRRSLHDATCSHCGKHRTINFMTLDRKPFCKACCGSPRASHACPDCKSVVKGSGDAPCMLCSIKRSNVRRQLGVQSLFATPQVQELNTEFTQWCNDSGRASKLAGGASHYLPFLAKLDVALQQRPGALTRELVIEVFSTEELRQMGILAKYLSETGLLSDDALVRRRRSDERMIASMLSTIENQPWAVEIHGFQKELASRETPLALRTHKAYLRAAISLLMHAKVVRASQIPQKAVNSMILKTPGQRASLSPFLAHLTTAYGSTLKVKNKVSKPTPAVRHAKYVRRLLDAMESAVERPARLAITAGLLSKLLNAPMEQVLQMRHSDLDLEKFEQVRLGDEWVRLPERIHPILRELPSEQWKSGLDADPFLFAGRLLMDGLSVTGARHHIKQVLEANQPSE